MIRSLIVKSTVTLLLSTLLVAAAQGVTITWFVGLGTGADPAQQGVQEAVVEAFNAMQDDITLKVVFVINQVSVETLSTLIATGEAPDIVGPVGFAGSNAFKGNFLDIQPYVDASGYDLSQFPEAAVEFQRTEEGLLGLPLANFPAFLYYRPEHFDEAGLEYPPASYGDPYILDGEEVEWDVDTMTEIAKILTVDANGNDATMDEFDPENIVQWGFMNQWAGPGAMRQHATLFGSGHLVDEDGNAFMPEHWRAAFNWLHQGIWEDHFIPTEAQNASDQLANDNAFSSGNLSMAQSHLWYTCCLADDGWDAAALPSYNGQATARLHADTFRILNTTEHPAEAFEVLAYLTGEASLDLLSVYGGMPARPDDQPQFFARLDEKYPQGVNWEVVRESLNFPDIPTHEAWLPNNNKTNDRIDALRSLLTSEPGVDVDAEIDKMIADLQAIYEEYYAEEGR
ncbi:MAG: extracellular solute-binding protein [Trueperaceae bacterium]|nr:MAG: extracellular solute-binding protein [Trueperaceae bacterium]